MISLLGGLKRYFFQNSKWFIISLAVWLAAGICGIVCAAATEGAVFDKTFEYVNSVFSQKTNLRTLTGNAIASEFKYVLLITLSSSAPVLLPATLALIAFKGFSAGFTATVIIKIYSLKGIGVSLLAVVLPMVFYLPVYFMIFVSSLKYSGEKLMPPPLRSIDGKTFASHLLSQFLLFALLCIGAVIQGIFTLAAQALI